MRRRHRRVVVAAGLVALAGLASRPAAAAAPATAPAAPLAENFTVHGQKRFSAAPVPNVQIHDPGDELRDPSTGAPMRRFGGAYIDANPVPPVNPGLQGDRSPIAAGVQR